MAPARRKLLDAALSLIREQGYCATTIDALCARAGVAKGSFFHHFADKPALAIAAADHWSTTTAELFASAPYHAAADPLERLFGYIALRRALIAGAIPEFTCLVGTMAQEVYQAYPAIRDACNSSIGGHAATLEADIAAAMQLYGVPADFTPRSLALHTQAVLQGAFILAKAKGEAAVAVESVDHLRRYIQLIFAPGSPLTPPRASAIAPASAAP
jgi:TetR/AcrR family transcriptional repressor of nem operon